ncbi:hypothetical protein AAII07_34180 [Microvirga sp. 0TCS3.31]
MSSSRAANYTLSAHVENLTIIGTSGANGYGNSVDNILVGNSSGNILEGGGGNDTLDGGGGRDALQGGTGDDLYIIDATDVLTEGAGAGTDTVRANSTYTLLANFEILELTGTGNINGTGNGLNNRITGTSGANVLDGGAGTDTLEGGVGNDTYVIDSLSDEVIDTSGTDWVQTSISFGDYSVGGDPFRGAFSRTKLLYDNVENMELIGSAPLAAVGNIGANYLKGNSANNVLDGVFCLVAERCWDQVRWAIENYTWRFDGSRRPPRAWWRI